MALEAWHVTCGGSKLPAPLFRGFAIDHHSCKKRSDEKLSDVYKRVFREYNKQVGELLHINRAAGWGSLGQNVSGRRLSAKDDILHRKAVVGATKLEALIFWRAIQIAA